MIKKIILVLIFISTSLFSSEINWEENFTSAIKKSMKQNKPVMFVYSRHSCKYCVILEKTAFSDKRAIKELNKNFVSVVSYTDENDYTPRNLMTPGTPAIWFLLPGGEPMYQPIMGAVDADNFLKALEIVKKEFNKSIGK